MTSETSELASLSAPQRGAMATRQSGLRVRIRTKLLIAFLGIAGLMVAIALTGISELQKANARTAELVRD